MNRSYFARYRRAVMGILLMSVAGIVLADDTEIFFQSGVTGSDASSIPQVMFNMEYTPNMGSNVCNGVTWENFQTACPKIYPIRHYLSPYDMPAEGDADYEVGRSLDQFQLTRAALKRVLAALGDLQVGMMLPHDNNNSCAGPSSGKCSAGGYIFQRMIFLKKPYAGFDPANPDLDQLFAHDPAKKEFFQRMDGLPSPGGNLSHSQQHKEVYYELFRYLTGQKIYNGHNGWNNFGTGPNSPTNTGEWEYRLTAPNNATQAFTYRCITPDKCGDGVTGPLPGGRYSKSGGVVQDYRYNGDFVAIGNPVTHYISSHPFKWDSKAEDGLHYLSPLEDCVRVFVINVLDGGGTAQNDADDDIMKSLAEGGMAFKPANNDPGFVQMVKWLHDKDLADGSITSGAGVLELLDKQNVTSYFIANQPQQLDNAAVAGGTGAAIRLTDDAEAVVAAIEKIFSEIEAVSSTFLAASIPVSSFDRGDMMDSTFMGIFQTDEDAKPFWPGNIKKVKLDTYEICVEVDELSGECNRYEKRLQLVDVSGEPAFSPVDELIRQDALTFWTNKQGFDLYDNIDEEVEQAGFDGRAVYRGGAGQQIPGFLNASNQLGVVTWLNTDGGRQLFTDSASGLIALDWSNIDTFWPYMYNEKSAFWPTTYNLAGVVTPMTGVWSHDAELYTQNPTVAITGCRTSFHTGASGHATCYPAQTYRVEHLASNVIAYMRGFDVIDENLDGVVWQSRRWLMGDILHSRPTPLNYGKINGHNEENPDIRIVFGSNDGYLRMLRNTESGGAESGKELWAFMPREVMGSQIQLMYNAAGGSPIHPYGVDGPVSFYVVDQDGTIDSTDGDQVLVTFGLRRGGQAVYGMDLTDPDDPQLLWSHDASSAGFEEMGYTFSQPVMRVLRWRGPLDTEAQANALRPVVIFGAGYDRDKKDTFDTVKVGSNDTMGNAIYIVDAVSGHLVWKVTGGADGTVTCDTNSNCVRKTDMTDSIPSDVAAVADRTGSLYRIYVGDTGGNVWRVDLTDGVDHTRSSPEVANWTAHRILELGRHAVADTDKLDNDRRFFHAPDIASARDEFGRYIAVIIGSGNRAHPLQTHTTDGLFMYKDRGPVDGAWPLGRNDLMNLTSNCLQEYGATCNVADGEDINLLEDGWKIYFLTEEESKRGEKSLGTALTLMNVVYFSTYVPAGVEDTSDMVCGPALGNSYEYAISLSDAGAVFDFDSTNNRTETDGDGNQIDVTLEKSDRRMRSPRPGLPVPPVLVSYDGVISVLTSAGMQYVGEADLMSTYWFEQNR